MLRERGACLMRSGALLILLLVAGSLAYSQVGQYPGGGYPGQYPGGGGGLPIPWPRRGGQRGGQGTNQGTPVNSTGKLSRLDNKSLEVELSDGRALLFRRTNRTKFFRDSKEVNASQFKTGDEVSVEATEDQTGNMTALTVTWQKAGDTADKTPAGTSTTTSTDAQPPVKDDQDSGPPTLKRGGLSPHPASETSETVQPSAPSYATPSPASDPLIEKARAAAESFSEGLPNYVCAEYMARYGSDSRPVNWRPIDVVSTEVLYEAGKESYRNVAINGKPTHKEIEEVGGSWSTGEYGTVLRDVLSPATAADFHSSRSSTIAGVTARVYDFTVQRENSHWHVQTGSQSINPAYKGSIWIDPATGRVFRIEMQARAMPREYPLDTVESAVDWENVRLGGGQFLLPVHAENLSCQRGSANCTRNAIDFRNYHKYEAQSDITFTSAK
jgi:hypothetical protein